MKTTEFIKDAMGFSKYFVTTLLEDMKDAPMKQPTVNGGNHPMWVLGHLVYSEANLIHHMILGETNPLVEWKSMFGDGKEVGTDLSQYPPYEELLAKFEEVRAHSLKVLDGLTDADLDKPSQNCPPEREDFVGTIGKVFSIVVLHPAMHIGQVADARRADGRKPLIA